MFRMNRARTIQPHIEVVRKVFQTLRSRYPFDFAQGPEPVEGGTTRATTTSLFCKVPQRLA
jgi:hypothetical protein